jgi:hypothetical protein
VTIVNPTARVRAHRFVALLAIRDAARMRMGAQDER